MNRALRLVVTLSLLAKAATAQPAEPPAAEPEPDPVLPEADEPAPVAEPTPPVAPAPAPPPVYTPPPPGYAAPAYGPYAPPPPPAPRADPSARRHDGFYFRFGFGAAYGRVSSEASAAGVSAEATYTGTGPAYELLLGGTPAAGWVLGGGFVGQDIVEPTVKVEQSPSGEVVAHNQALGIGALGPFVDWYPDDRSGVHLGALAGLGVIGLTNENDESATGLGLSLFGGYDFWVGEQWSIGPQARVLWVRASRRISDVTFDDSATSIQLLFSALLH